MASLFVCRKSKLASWSKLLVELYVAFIDEFILLNLVNLHTEVCTEV